MGFFKIIMAFIFAALILFGLITYSITTGLDNDAPTSLLEDESFSRTYVDMNDTLEEFQEQAEEQRTNFETDNPLRGIGFFVLETIISGGKIFTSMVISVFTLMIFPLSDIIGIPPIFLGVFTSVLIVGLVLAAWRVYKAGE